MLSTFFSGLWSRLTGYAIAIGAALAILFAAYRKGQKDAAARENERRLKSIKKAKEVEHEISGLDDDSVSRELDRWMRDRGR